MAAESELGRTKSEVSQTKKRSQIEIEQIANRV
jgi:hypothetical protein